MLSLHEGICNVYYLILMPKQLKNLKGFNYQGYGFSEVMSTEKELVFIR